jgi:hypothetical protein
MNRNVFKHLRKKILENSIITEEIIDGENFYRVECFGFNAEVSFSEGVFKKDLVIGHLIDKLVENPDFLRKLEQMETRKDNLKTLLD